MKLLIFILVLFMGSCKPRHSRFSSSNDPIQTRTKVLARLLYVYTAYKNMPALFATDASKNGSVVEEFIDLAYNKSRSNPSLNGKVDADLRWQAADYAIEILATLKKPLKKILYDGKVYTNGELILQMMDLIRTDGTKGRSGSVCTYAMECLYKLEAIVSVSRFAIHFDDAEETKYKELVAALVEDTHKNLLNTYFDRVVKFQVRLAREWAYFSMNTGYMNPAFAGMRVEETPYLKFVAKMKNATEQIIKEVENTFYIKGQYKAIKFASFITKLKEEFERSNTPGNDLPPGPRSKDTNIFSKAEAYITRPIAHKVGEMIHRTYDSAIKLRFLLDRVNLRDPRPWLQCIEDRARSFKADKILWQYHGKDESQYTTLPFKSYPASGKHCFGRFLPPNLALETLYVGKESAYNEASGAFGNDYLKTMQSISGLFKGEAYKRNQAILLKTSMFKQFVDQKNTQLKELLQQLSLPSSLMTREKALSIEIKDFYSLFYQFMRTQKNLDMYNREDLMLTMATTKVGKDYQDCFCPMLGEPDLVDRSCEMPKDKLERDRNRRLIQKSLDKGSMIESVENFCRQISPLQREEVYTQNKMIFKKTLVKTATQSGTFESTQYKVHKEMKKEYEERLAYLSEIKVVDNMKYHCLATDDYRNKVYPKPTPEDPLNFKYFGCIKQYVFDLGKEDVSFFLDQSASSKKPTTPIQENFRRKRKNINHKNYLPFGWFENYFVLDGYSDPFAQHYLDPARDIRKAVGHGRYNPLVNTSGINLAGVCGLGPNKTMSHLTKRIETFINANYHQNSCKTTTADGAVQVLSTLLMKPAGTISFAIGPKIWGAIAKNMPIVQKYLATNPVLLAELESAVGNVAFRQILRKHFVNRVLYNQVPSAITSGVLFSMVNKLLLSATAGVPLWDANAEFGRNMFNLIREVGQGAMFAALGPWADGPAKFLNARLYNTIHKWGFIGKWSNKITAPLYTALSEEILFAPPDFAITFGSYAFESWWFDEEVEGETLSEWLATNMNGMLVMRGMNIRRQVGEVKAEAQKLRQQIERTRSTLDALKNNKVQLMERRQELKRQENSLYTAMKLSDPDDFVDLAAKVNQAELDMIVTAAEVTRGDGDSKNQGENLRNLLVDVGFSKEEILKIKNGTYVPTPDDINRAYGSVLRRIEGERFVKYDELVKNAPESAKDDAKQSLVQTIDRLRDDAAFARDVLKDTVGLKNYIKLYRNNPRVKISEIHPDLQAGSTENYYSLLSLDPKQNQADILRKLNAIASYDGDGAEGRKAALAKDAIQYFSSPAAKIKYDERLKAGTANDLVPKDYRIYKP